LSSKIVPTLPKIVSYNPGTSKIPRNRNPALEDWRRGPRLAVTPAVATKFTALVSKMLMASVNV
jgi:hypothetical protein